MPYQKLSTDQTCQNAGRIKSVSNQRDKSASSITRNIRHMTPRARESSCLHNRSLTIYCSTYSRFHCSQALLCSFEHVIALHLYQLPLYTHGNIYYGMPCIVRGNRAQLAPRMVIRANVRWTAHFNEEFRRLKIHVLPIKRYN